MDLGEMLRLTGRRWYAAVPAFLTAGALIVLTYLGIPTDFQSQSTISMLNSASASAIAPHLGNPFLSFDSSLTPTADFLARRLNSDQSGTVLRSRGVTETVGAKLADNASGPFVTLTVTGTDKAHVLRSMQIFDDFAAEQLLAIQQGPQTQLLPNTLIRSVVIVPPQTPVAQSKSKIEAVAAVGAVSLVLAFFSVVGLDAVLSQRAARRRESRTATREADVEQDAPEEVDVPVTPPASRRSRNEKSEQADEAGASTESDETWEGTEGYFAFGDLAVAERESGTT